MYTRFLGTTIYELFFNYTVSHSVSEMTVRMAQFFQKKFTNEDLMSNEGALAVYQEMYDVTFNYTDSQPDISLVKFPFKKLQWNNGFYFSCVNCSVYEREVSVYVLNHHQ